MQPRFPGVLFLFILLLTGVPAVSGQEVLDRIVAVVENEVILQSDLDEATQLWVLQSQQRPRSQEEYEALQRQLLQQMIDGKVLTAAARRDSLQATADQVDATVKQEVERVQQQFGTPEALEQELAKYGLTVRDWHRMLRKQKEEEIIQRRLEEKQFGTVRVTGTEVEQFYVTYKDSIPARPTMVTLSHIMMTPQPGEELAQKALARIQDLQQRVKGGADFAELARQYSEDIASAQKGGDLGFFSKGTFMPEFEEAALALQPGQVSEAVKTPYGYHLIKMEAKSGDQAHVRHILIQLQATADDERRTRENLSFLRQRIVDGRENFTDAARKYSEDITSNNEGGSLGTIPLDQLQPQIREVIDRLKDGEISESVKLESEGKSTYHLFKLENRTGGKPLTIEDGWDDIAKLARNHKWQTERRRWLDTLRHEVYVEEQ